MSAIRRYWWLILPIGAVAIGGAASYLAGQLAISNPSASSGRVQLTPQEYPTPEILTPFAQVDPALIAELEAHGDVYGTTPLAGYGDVVPVGSYLPSGTMGLEAPTPTHAPTYTASATFSPTRTRVPPPSPTPLPFDYSAGVGVADVPWGCAPHGLPVGGWLTQRFHRWHSGIDLGVPVGTPVLATHSGRIEFAGWSTVGYGNLIILNNGRFTTYYAHLNAFNVQAGQYVLAGAIIGWSGNTGNSTGPHLHYETRIDGVPVDPLTFDARGFRHC